MIILSKLRCAGILLTLSFIVGCNQTTSVDTFPQTLTPAVIKGTPATGADPREDRLVRLAVVGCTGSLLNNHWVITAAHCANDARSVEIYKNGKYFTISRTFIHPDLDRLRPTDFDDLVLYLADVALVEVNEPISVNSSKYNFRQKIYANSLESLVGKEFRVFGYGGAFTFRWADLSVEGPRRWVKRYSYLKNIKGQITEDGDSGSPEYLGDELIGVHSDGGWGFGDAVASEFFRDWVMAVTNTELETSVQEPVVLRGTKNLASRVLTTFSAPAGLALSGFDITVEQKRPGSTPISGKVTFLRREDRDGQWRDTYSVSIDNYLLDSSECGNLLGVRTCLFDVKISVSNSAFYGASLGRSIVATNMAVLR